MTVDDFLTRMKLDKKNKQGKLRLIVLGVTGLIAIMFDRFCCECGFDGIGLDLLGLASTATGNPLNLRYLIEVVCVCVFQIPMFGR